VVVAAGCALLTLRPVLLAHGHVVAVVAALFAVLGLVGWAWPRPIGAVVTRPPVGRLALIGAAGIGAFALGRLLGGGEAPAPVVARVIALNSLAAVAEEAFFRRMAYDALAARGPLVAVVATSVLFAVVHVTVYGFWVLPLDLAAGLVLGWQRWASGTWALPAVTHVLANLLVVLP
jgi:membrane protease YdiL (CAAX protease family)